MIQEHNKIHRCSICNSVNVSDIETNIGDYHKGMSFVPDRGKRFSDICIECDEVIQEALGDYEFMDNMNSKENKNVKRSQRE